MLRHIHAALEGESGGFLHGASSHGTCGNGRSAAAECIEACAMQLQPDGAGINTVGRRCAASDSIAHVVELAAAEPEG